MPLSPGVALVQECLLDHQFQYSAVFHISMSVSNQFFFVSVYALENPLLESSVMCYCYMKKYFLFILNQVSDIWEFYKLSLCLILWKIIF